MIATLFHRVTPPTFYKRLWRETEREREAADADLIDMACLALDLLDAIGADDSPNAVVRGAVRKLRIVATDRAKGVIR